MVLPISGNPNPNPHKLCINSRPASGWVSGLALSAQSEILNIAASQTELAVWTSRHGISYSRAIKTGL